MEISADFSVEFGARKTPITRNLVVLQDKGR
jgi:hypothetical protein